MRNSEQENYGKENARKKVTTNQEKSREETEDILMISVTLSGPTVLTNETKKVKKRKIKPLQFPS